MHDLVNILHALTVNRRRWKYPQHKAATNDSAIFFCYLSLTRTLFHPLIFSLVRILSLSRPSRCLLIIVSIVVYRFGSFTFSLKLAFALSHSNIFFAIHPKKKWTWQANQLLNNLLQMFECVFNVAKSESKRRTLSFVRTFNCHIKCGKTYTSIHIYPYFSLIFYCLY